MALLWPHAAIECRSKDEYGDPRAMRSSGVSTLRVSTGRLQEASIEV
jgi:hypothetical protein